MAITVVDFAFSAEEYNMTDVAGQGAREEVVAETRCMLDRLICFTWIHHSWWYFKSMDVLLLRLKNIEN